MIEKPPKLLDLQSEFNSRIRGGGVRKEMKKRDICQNLIFFVWDRRTSEIARISIRTQQQNSGRIFSFLHKKRGKEKSAQISFVLGPTEKPPKLLEFQ